MYVQVLPGTEDMLLRVDYMHEQSYSRDLLGPPH